jgi:hypothetical protein
MAVSDALKFYPDATATGVVNNEVEEGAGDAGDAVATAIAAREKWVEFSTGEPIASASEAERAKRKEVALAAPAGAEPLMSELLTLNKLRFSPLFKVLGKFDQDYVPIPYQPVVDQGMLWWARTSWWVPNDRIGLYAYWGDGGVHFVGQLDYDDGDLWKGSAGASAAFGLGTDRMPAAGRYISTPTADLFGEVMGFTGVNGPLNWGDDWCKCWLHTDQTLRNASGAIIGNGHEARNLIFYEDDGSFGVAPLPGTMLFPSVAFDLDPSQPLTVTLEVKFDFQLEGSSMFRFGNFGGFVAAFFRTPQWTIRRA